MKPLIKMTSISTVISDTTCKATCPCTGLLTTKAKSTWSVTVLHCIKIVTDHVV